MTADVTHFSRLSDGVENQSERQNEDRKLDGWMENLFYFSDHLSLTEYWNQRHANPTPKILVLVKPHPLVISPQSDDRLYPGFWF